MPISIHALREEGDTQLTLLEQTTGIISIHALREEGDQSCASGTAYAKNDFYPRPPRGGRLAPRVFKPRAVSISIHALREEGDDGANPEENQQWHFYPRPPRGGRPSAEAGATVQKGISIHALREEGDAQRWTKRSLVIRFLSTPSARRATLPGGDQIWPGEISIHALREEGDDYFAPSSGLQGHFYPRPPRGGRQQKQRQNLYFQTNYTTFCTNLEEP